MEDLRIRFGRLVAAHRKTRGLSQQQLADAVDMSVEMIRRLEAGRTGTRFKGIESLAQALSVDPAELFTIDLPDGALERGALTDLTARLSSLSDQDLGWVEGVLDAVLKPRRDRTVQPVTPRTKAFR